MALNAGEVFIYLIHTLPLLLVWLTNILSSSPYLDTSDDLIFLLLPVKHAHGTSLDKEA